MLSVPLRESRELSRAASTLLGALLEQQIVLAIYSEIKQCAIELDLVELSYPQVSRKKVIEETIK